MKKITLAIIPAIILALASTQLMAAGGRDKGHKIIDSDKFLPVCHKSKHPNIGKLPPGNPHPFLLWVPAKTAYKHHMDRHGDAAAVVDPSTGKYTCEPVVKTFCGDGIKQEPNDDGVTEYCDDGNDNDNDSCPNDCLQSPG